VIILVTIDYILIGVAVLLAILDVVMSIIHFKPISEDLVLQDASLDVSNTNSQEISNDDNTSNIKNI